MRERKNCDADSLVSLISGSLGETARAEVVDHLVECPGCRITLDALRTSDGVIGDASRFVPRQIAANLREAHARLHAAEDEGVRLLAFVLSEGSDAWREIVAADDRLRSAGVVRAIISLADDCYRTLITRAVELYAFAVDVAEMLRDSEESDRVAVIALRKWGVALTARGECRDGLRAINFAETHIGQWPDSDAELAALHVARAFPLRLLGRHDEARMQLAEAKETAARYSLTELLASAIYAEAGIVYDAKAYAAARALYDRTAKEMRMLGERQMEAQAENMVGQCFAREGDVNSAIERWAKAKALFVKCGMHGDTIRISIGIARLKLRAGEFEEGLDILRETARDFESLAMRRDAIDVSLEIVEHLVDTDDDWGEVVRRCSDLLPKAQAAGLAEQASVALAYLRRAANERSIDADYVRHVRHFIRDIGVVPSAAFQPPRSFRG